MLCIRTAFFSSLTLFWVVVGVTIEKSYSADLWDIYELALTDDQEYRVAVFAHESARINLPLARSAFKPSLTASSGVAHNRGKQDTLVTGIDFNVNLPLYDKSKRLGITQSGYQVDIATLQLRQAKQQLILRVANRYFNLLAAQDTQAVAHLEKIAIRRQMELATERLQVGLVTKTDVFDAKARFKLAEANEIQAQNRIHNSLTALIQIIGRTPEALSVLDDATPLELPVPNDAEVWNTRGMAHNLDIQVNTLHLEVALQDINKQRAGRWPTINMSGNMAFIADGNNTSVATLSVKLPLYLGGTIALKTEQAGLNYNRVERLLAQTRRVASSKTSSAFLAVTSGISRVRALLDAVTAGESALQAKKQGFSAGLTTNLDVLDAQRDLSRSRTEYLRTRYDYIIAVLELEMSVGQLDEADIKRVNSWLTSQ